MRGFALLELGKGGERRVRWLWFDARALCFLCHALRVNFLALQGTQAPNHPHGRAMISRQPVRLSGAGQRFGARCVGYGEVSREKALRVLKRPRDGGPISS